MIYARAIYLNRSRSSMAFRECFNFIEEKAKGHFISSFFGTMRVYLHFMSALLTAQSIIYAPFE